MKTFNVNPEFERFVVRAGGPAEASRRHNIPESLISLIRNGKREVSKNLAKQIIEAYPNEFNLSLLLFPKKDRTAA